MHLYLEKATVALETLRRPVFSLTNFKLALFVGAVIIASLAFLCVCISWIRGKQKRNRHILLERELYRVQDPDDMHIGKRITVIDAYRFRFPLDDSTKERTTGTNHLNTIDEESKRNVEGNERT